MERDIAARERGKVKREQPFEEGFSEHVFSVRIKPEGGFFQYSVPVDFSNPLTASFLATHPIRAMSTRFGAHQFDSLNAFPRSN